MRKFGSSQGSVTPKVRSRYAEASLSLRGMTIELWLILAYAVAVAVGDLRVAKIGIQIGPIPVFLTDITLGILLLTSFARWPSRILFWMSEGAGAGGVGRLVWALCVMASIYFALSISRYRLYAVRDLAIFGYSLFFPLTYLAIRDARDAKRLLRYFTYAGVVLALMVLFQSLTGIGVGLGSGERTLMGHTVRTIADADSGAFCVFSLAGLCAYVTLEHEHRIFHALSAAACFLALAISTSRAGVVAFVAALAVTLLCAGARQRIRLAVLVGLFGVLVATAPLMPANAPGVKFLRGFRISMRSASDGPSRDPTSQFRIVRWDYASELWMRHPFLGVGFGHEVIPKGLVDKREREGRFNAGMPHNTFLFLAVRSGLLGLGIVLLSWLIVFKGLVAGARSGKRADELAAANILAAMFWFAMFSLFFERPVTNAAFWIVLAAGARLTGYRKETNWTLNHPNVRDQPNFRTAQGPQPEGRRVGVPRRSSVMA